MKNIIKQIMTQTSLSEQEAWWMLQHITQKTKQDLLFIDASSLSDQEQQTISDWINKLTKKSIPLSYLLGFVPFLDLTIIVFPPVLIPRPETEEWVSQLIAESQPHKNSIKTILDIGTGSGCIALALAKHFPHSLVTAIDSNPQALQLAQENAAGNNIKNIIFIKSDVFEKLQNQSFDLIVSNPPYIDPAHKLAPQVALWEDKNALFAQDHGLGIIKKIIQQAPRFLAHKTDLSYQLILEHDHDQQNVIKQYALEYGFDCTNKKDLFGNYRTSWCKLIN